MISIIIHACCTNINNTILIFFIIIIILFFYFKFNFISIFFLSISIYDLIA